MRDFVHQARSEAVAWAREMMGLDDFRVLDTETTGLDHDAQVIEIAVVSKAGYVLLSTRVKPTVPISPGAIAVHGITEAMVAAAPTFEQVYPALAACLQGQQVIVYNRDFDMRLVNRAARLLGLPKAKPLAAHCAMKHFAAYYGDWNPRRRSFTWKSLDFAAAALGVEVAGLHSAVGDCLATLGVVQAMAKAS